ncbi:hypothetical protein NSK_005730 [Nannochloropsis salina CCMP1776]|uniref:THIF-type NAD/FAD binding fold domain-containing protein n=1 Tax=Nannochloropsis salina CCMP1776 TaxID=1027361 RepID=A0A4D9CXP8_9STRA|nr:hypothetical protein NSK_005730 [Nannochloropsis salina CCMP1776]|eukprot:TFJ82957.1 hypothetical protein NSK_005730 [Nannochloropsis salina CCMP1776]
MLVRSGVQRIRVIDFDQVTLSSLNRHAVAGLKDVGLSKAEVLKTRLMELGLPRLQIDACRALFKMETASVLLGPWKETGGGEGEEGVLPTYVFDCIDDVQTKAELLMYAQDHHLRVISALGAGLKADPTRLCIGELDNTKNEPLAIKLRYLLRKQGRACTGITTVYSHEKPRGSLLPLTDEQEAAPSEFGILEHMRLRVLPVLGTMPALFGQAMAAFVLCELAGQSLQPVAVEGLSRNVKHRLLQHLRNRERVTFQNHDTWDKEKPPLIENLVLFSSAALADKFDVEGPGMLPNERRKRVEARLNLFT